MATGFMAAAPSTPMRKGDVVFVRLDLILAVP